MAKQQWKSKFNRMRWGHPWLAVIFYFIIGQLFLLGLTILIASMIAYALDSKITGEINSVEYMASLYAKYGESEQTQILLEAGDRDYVIRRADGEVIYQKGDNTVGENAGAPKIDLLGVVGSVSLTMDGDEEEVPFKIYGDSLQPYFNVDGSGRVKADLKMIWKSVREVDLFEAIEDRDGAAAVDSLRSIDLPLWVAIEDPDKNEFIGKIAIRLEYKDIGIVLLIGGSLAFLSVLLFVILIVNVFRSIARQKRLTTFFFTDTVTNGRNWMYFLTRTERELKKGRNAGKRYAIAHLAIVKYRNYCMCHSISEGEQLLIRVSRTLEKYMGKREFCAHVSSGSFALFLEAGDETLLRQRLKGMLEQLATVDKAHHFAFQIGVQLIEANYIDRKVKRRTFVDPERDYNNACTAKATLEDSDDSGIAFFDEQMREQRKWEDIVNELQEKALAEDEFIVYYQPKCAPDTEELKGAEALIRWKPKDPEFFKRWRNFFPPETKLVPPGMFIPIFEKNGFITRIDHFMLESVARDQKAWLDAGFKCVPVSVNVSRAHFAEEDLAEQIRDTVDKAGTPHELVEIELTESAFFDDKNALIRTIERLKDYGFAVSMDDFGSGYSSLNSLKDMALDVLKLDAEFFRGDADEERKQIVVGEAIRLAKNLDMRIVAEGVEEKDQVDFLAGQGCDMIQGFYFARPMPKADYEKKMQG